MSPTNASDSEVPEPANPSAIPPEILAEAAVWVARLHGPSRSPRMDRECLSWQRSSPIHRRAFERCTDVWQDAAGVKLSTYATAAEPKPVRQYAGLAVRVAGLGAVFAVAALFALRPWVSAAVFETGIGEQRVVVLSDGSRMSLNTATRVRVDFSRARRGVQVLDGEALFEVAKDAQRPFVVQAANSEVVATGTEFMVRTAQDAAGTGKAITVTLVEGRVIVRDAQQRQTPVLAQPVAMVPGDRLQVEQSASNAARRPSHPVRLDRPGLEAALAWKRGEVVFDDVSLVDAVAEMNRYSTVPIIVASSAAQSSGRISGVFRTGDNLGFARAVARLHGLRIIEAPNRIEVVLSDEAAAAHAGTGRLL
ncbi:FecR domain-containing protein [Burkholderiaceae bacterium UC74_6]